MSLLTKIFSATAGKFIETVGNVADKFHLSGEEKQKFLLDMETLLQQRDAEIENTIRTELNAKMSIMVAELNQGDNYTKRARPTVVYFGLVVITFNYCIIPTIQMINGLEIIPFNLPTEFWVAWGGIVSTWVIGRSAEKRGARGPVVETITGTPALDLKL